jgi:type IV secretion system protein VirD4
MRLPLDEQIIHVKDIGFIHCRKLGQNQIAPFCHELADNPLEGGQLSPDPKVSLPVRRIKR